jgi:acid phosphatase family membrane protein YuiD
MSILRNYVLISALSGWLVAQTIKCIVILVKDKKFNPKQIPLSSGGMPSAHSATICALCTAIAVSEGLGSSIFALAAVFALLVMYDAVGVRQAAGQHAKVLNHFMGSNPKHRPTFLQHDLKEKIGHTPAEVVVGALLGVFIALLIAFLTK